MSDETRSDDSKNDNPSNTNTPKKSNVNISRRRLAQGALAAPVLMTLPSRSVLAGNCNTLSGILSGNLSGTDGGSEPCADFSSSGGNTPEFWMNNCQIGWPISPSLALFGDESTVPPGLFSAVPEVLKTVSLLTLLHTTNVNYCEQVDGEKFDFLKFSVVAYLNSLAIDGYFVTPGQVKDIVFHILTTGIYGDDVASSHVFDVFSMNSLYSDSWGSGSGSSLGITGALGFTATAEECAAAMAAADIVCDPT